MIGSHTRSFLLMSIVIALTAGCSVSAEAPDRKDRVPPQVFEPPPSRNMVNLKDRNLPTSWSVEEGKFENVKWSANLGSATYGGPVVANGRVFVATNNSHAGVGKATKSVLMALRETDGKPLWQNSHDHPKDLAAPSDMGGVPSMPAVDGDDLFYVTPACEIICADGRDGKVAWRYDMAKELKVVAGAAWCKYTPPPGSPLVVGDLVFAFTGNGRDVDGKLASPAAPSFVALHKKTGKLAWQSNLPGTDIVEGQWSSPTYADVNGTPQVIFASGDRVIYSFDPKSGTLLWKCHCLPTPGQHANRVDNYFIATPVVLGDRLYVGMGLTGSHPRPATSWSYFLCLDITKKGDVSIKSYDPKSPANKDSALVWVFGGPVQPSPKNGRQDYFGRMLSTAAVHDGLVYLSEEDGYLHCLDAKTGKRFWMHDLRATIFGSPFWADGKVYLATEDGEVHILMHGTKKVLLAKIDMEDAILTTPVAANGVLFVMTRSKLFAIGPR